MRKYDKIMRLGKEDVEGILDGTVYVQEKIDGANCSVYYDSLLQEIVICSHSREIARIGEAKEKILDEFRGLVDHVRNHEKIVNMIKQGTDYIFYGEWLCLSGDTVIRKISGGKLGNYLTLREMYQYNQKTIKVPSTQKLKIGKKTYYSDTKKSWWELYGYPKLYSLDLKKDLIFPQRMQRIIFSGYKIVYELKTRKGLTIKSTLEHKFFTPVGWKSLKSLKINDCVAVTFWNVYRQNRNIGKGSHKALLLRKKYKKSKEICENCGTKTCLVVHHKDGNFRNNRISNFKLVCTDCHRLEHKKRKPFTKGKEYEFDKIISIKKIGEEDCYDISMSGTENNANFIANNFIVHNCKHTVAYPEELYKHVYFFDIYNKVTHEYVDPELAEDVFKKYKVKYVPIIETLKHPQIEDVKKYLTINTFKGIPQQEGVVIKRAGYVNKFGRTQWAKIVNEKFQERRKEIWKRPKKNEPVEGKIALTYTTRARVEKMMNKMQDSQTKVDERRLGELLQRVYHDIITEDAWEFIKKYKNPVIDFKVLKKEMDNEVKRIFFNVLEGRVSN